MAPRNGPVTTLGERILFRWADYDTPFWARANLTEGRWNRPGEGPTQYWCLDPSGPWAELVRHEDLRREAELDLVRATLWVCRWSIGPVADMGTFEKAAEWGIDPRILVQDDWTRCQRLATELRALGYAGVVAPSAALPGSTSMIGFRAQVMTAFDATPRLSGSVPAQIVAIGRPGPGLTLRVRYVGDRHAGWDAYRAAARARAERPPKDP